MLGVPYSNFVSIATGLVSNQFVFTLKKSSKDYYLGMDIPRGLRDWYMIDRLYMQTRTHVDVFEYEKYLY